MATQEKGTSATSRTHDIDVETGRSGPPAAGEPESGREHTDNHEEYNKRPACFRTTAQEVVCIIVLTMGMGQSSLSLGVCQVITEVIGVDLAMTQGEIAWINASAALTCGAFLMFFGSTADTFGRKRQLLTAYAVFTAACLVNGFATTPIMFHVFRGVQGLCAAAAIPAAIGILGAAYAHASPRKNKAFAAFSAGNPVGFVVGSIASGIATQLFDWRAPFYLLAIVYAAVAAAAAVCVPRDPEPIRWGAWRSLDVAGAASVTLGLVLVCAALTLAGNAPAGWRSPYILVFLVLGVLLLAAFVWWEGRCAQPLMPLYLWRDGTFSMLMVIVSMGFMNFITSQFWLCLYFQDIRRLSSLLTAVWLIPQALSGVLVNVVAAFALSRVDNRVLLLLGALAYAASSALFASERATTVYWAHIFPGLVVSVVGADLMYNVANMYVMSSMPKAQQSTAGGMFNTVLQLAQAVGLGISTAVYNAVVDTRRAPDRDEVMRGYTAVFCFATGAAASAIVVIPALKIRTQGAVDKAVPAQTQPGSVDADDDDDDDDDIGRRGRAPGTTPAASETWGRSRSRDALPPVPPAEAVAVPERSASAVSRHRTVEKVRQDNTPTPMTLVSEYRTPATSIRRASDQSALES